MFVSAATACRECKKPATAKTFRFRSIRKTSTDPIHRAFECTTCHSDVSQVPHQAELKPVQCDTCHTASVKAYSESIHAKARAQGFKEPPTCTSCHGDIHKLVPRSEPSSPVHPTKYRQNLRHLSRRCGNGQKISYPSSPAGGSLPAKRSRARRFRRKRRAPFVRIAMARTLFFPLTMRPRKFRGRKFPRLAVGATPMFSPLIVKASTVKRLRAASGTPRYVPTVMGSIGSWRAMSQTRRYSRPTSPVKLAAAAMPIRE